MGDLYFLEWINLIHIERSGIGLDGSKAAEEFKRPQLVTESIYRTDLYS